MPNAPAELVAWQPPGYYPQVTTGILAWYDANVGKCGTHVYREVQGDDSEADHLYASVAAGAITWTDPGPLLPGRRYTYHVRAFDDSGESPRNPEADDTACIEPREET